MTDDDVTRRAPDRQATRLRVHGRDGRRRGGVPVRRARRPRRARRAGAGRRRRDDGRRRAGRSPTARPTTDRPRSHAGAAGERRRPAPDDLSYPERLGKTPRRRNDSSRRLRRRQDRRRRPMAPPDVARSAGGEGVRLPPLRPGLHGRARDGQLHRPGRGGVPHAKKPKRIVNSLKAKGYDAFVFAPAPGTRGQVPRPRRILQEPAGKPTIVAQRLLREDKRYKPWVTR